MLRRSTACSTASSRAVSCTVLSASATSPTSSRVFTVMGSTCGISTSSPSGVLRMLRTALGRRVEAISVACRVSARSGRVSDLRDEPRRDQGQGDRQGGEDAVGAQAPVGVGPHVVGVGPQLVVDLLAEHRVAEPAGLVARGGLEHQVDVDVAGVEHVLDDLGVLADVLLGEELVRHLLVRALGLGLDRLGVAAQRPQQGGELVDLGRRVDAVGRRLDHGPQERPDELGADVALVGAGVGELGTAAQAGVGDRGHDLRVGVVDLVHDRRVAVEDLAHEGVELDAPLALVVGHLLAQGREVVEGVEGGLVLLGDEAAVALDHGPEVLDGGVGLGEGLFLVLHRQRDGVLCPEEVGRHRVALQLDVEQQARRAERGGRDLGLVVDLVDLVRCREHLQPGHDDEREDGTSRVAPSLNRIGTLRTKRTPPQRGALPVRSTATACEYALGRLDPSQGGRC